MEKRFDPGLIGPTHLALITDVIDRASRDAPLETASRLRQLATEVTTNVTERSPSESLQVAVAASLLADLWEQGWTVRVESAKVYLRVPDDGASSGEKRAAAKARLRSGLLIASDRQLASDAVQEFLRFMERERVFRGGVVSVRSVIDSGDSLAAEIERAISSSGDIGSIIKPVIEVCDPESRCRFTGLKLQDIWRYFRHTWSLEYNPSPGRTLRFLVRNKARKNWPVIGIAMLASPAANLYVRDQWIGWTIDELIARLLDGRWEAARVAKVLMSTLRDAIAAIRSDDLLSPSETRRPSKQAIFRLQQISGTAHGVRQRDLVAHAAGSREGFVDIRSMARGARSEGDWLTLSGTGLFLRKRSEQLVPLLQTLRLLQELDFESAPAAVLYEMLATRRGREAVKFILAEIRKDRLATQVADLSVCGAVEPYNHILGGKLVALAMTSRDARDAYKKRYKHQASEIASQLAGRSIVKSADLKILTTTSLYGIGSSQYNRLKLRPSEHTQLHVGIEWVELDPTEGFTVTHLSRKTVEYMRGLGGASYGRRRINSVFGEGSSPRTRQVREGLNLIGINDDSVLRQGLKRRVYACELFPDARASLVGLVKKKARGAIPPLTVIGKAWIDRWVLGRVRRSDVIEALKRSGPGSVVKELRVRSQRGRLVEGGANLADDQLDFVLVDPSKVVDHRESRDYSHSQ